MTRWSGIVLARGAGDADGMRSRLPAFLHPVAGRSVVWHAVAALFAVQPAPERVTVVSEVELSPELFQDAGGDVVVLSAPGGELSRLEPELAPAGGESVLVLSGCAVPAAGDLGALPGGDAAAWLPASPHAAVAAWLPPGHLGPFLRLPDPLSTPNGVLADPQRLAHSWRGVLVTDRAALGRATALVRDRLVGQLMEAGVTFLLPDSVLVDVDVRIGRDSVVYPGVVLEGQTTVGEETVIGPGSRVISSWIGSGVELKGWNYIAHTSIRNRAILEPYVRRGFD